MSVSCLFCLSFVCVHGEDSLGLCMEDLRSAEREGPSPIEACQIRKRGEKKIKPLLLGLIRTSTNSILLCMCVCFCVHVLIKQRSSVGLCGFFFLVIFIIVCFTRHRSWETLQTTLMKVRIQRSRGNKSAKKELQQNNRRAAKLKASGDFRKIPKFPGFEKPTRTERVTDTKQ